MVFPGTGRADACAKGGMALYCRWGTMSWLSAPTGTGKTLSAFLVFLDQMMRQADEGLLKQELQVIYVSPLKSLAADIRENLRRPLAGIGMEEHIQVGIRTGDTAQRDRQRMIKHPPHILIITPESLYLMLTSKTGQQVLAPTQTVIIDELHALIDTKRGAHLMLSLARLDACARGLCRELVYLPLFRLLKMRPHILLPSRFLWWLLPWRKSCSCRSWVPMWTAAGEKRIRYGRSFPLLYISTVRETGA